jgi:hypothetical protein
MKKLPSQHITDNEKKDFHMATITQDIKFRPFLIRYAEKHGVTKASRKYTTNRQDIYR